MMAINGSLFSSSTYTVDSVSDKQHRLMTFPGGVNKSSVFPCESKLSFAPLKVSSSSSQETAVTFQSPVPASKAGLGFAKNQKWWEKGLQPNMKDVSSAQDLADSLRNAGDKLVVVTFFSPGCGACKTLHPKMCQMAQLNPDIEFLLVNSEEHKSMCYTLRVHVLPFFRFYKGAHGRVCSFSCTTATIKKFKDAVAKYNVDFCSIEPTKGLEEEELLALAANSDLSFTYTRKEQPPFPDSIDVVAPPHLNSGGRQQPLPLPLPLPLKVTSDANQMDSQVAYRV